MAARKRRIGHDDDVRKKIQTSQLINRLSSNALGTLKAEMSTSQVRSAEILLRKALPDLSQVELEAGESIGRIVKFITGFSSPQGGPKRG